MAKNPFQGDDVDPFSGVRDEETGEIKREASSASESKAETPKKQSFGQAFAAARKAGDSSFMFNGKKYTTKTKDEEQGKRARSAASNPKDNPYYGRTVAQRAASMKAKGGSIKMATGGSVKSSASKRADGCAVKGKTRGKMV